MTSSALNGAVRSICDRSRASGSASSATAASFFFLSFFFLRGERRRRVDGAGGSRRSRTASADTTGRRDAPLALVVAHAVRQRVLDVDVGAPDLPRLLLLLLVLLR
jgi:hypothetical protein